MAGKPDSKSEFISTAQAARQLGLSLGAVQQMVESGTLAGWKTAGGHRRIRQDSVRRPARPSTLALCADSQRR